MIPVIIQGAHTGGAGKGARIQSVIHLPCTPIGTPLEAQSCESLACLGSFISHKGYTGAHRLAGVLYTSVRSRVTSHKTSVCLAGSCLRCQTCSPMHSGQSPTLGGGGMSAARAFPATASNVTTEARLALLHQLSRLTQHHVNDAHCKNEPFDIGLPPSSCSCLVLLQAFTL